MTLEEEDNFRKRLAEGSGSAGGGKRQRAALLTVLSQILAGEVVPEASDRPEQSERDKWMVDGMDFPCIRGFTLGNLLDKPRTIGVLGRVYALEQPYAHDVPEQVVKIQTHTDPVTENAMQNIFAGLGLAPKIHASCLGIDLRFTGVGETGRIVWATRMDRLTGTLEDFLLRDPHPTGLEMNVLLMGLQSINKALINARVSYGGFSPHNIGYYDDRAWGTGRHWRLIDFSSARSYSELGQPVEDLEIEAADLDDLISKLNRPPRDRTAMAKRIAQALRALIVRGLKDFFPSDVSVPRFLARIAKWIPTPPNPLLKWTEETESEGGGSPMEESTDGVTPGLPDAAAADKETKIRPLVVPCDTEVWPLMTKMFFPCLSGWTIEEHIGAGRYGCVYLVCKQGTVCQAVKIEDDDPGAENAWQMHIAKLGLAPVIYAQCEGIRNVPLAPGEQNKRLFATRMERVDGTLHEFLHGDPAPTTDALEGIVSRLKTIILALNDRHLTHGDLHPNNLGYIEPDPADKQHVKRRWVLLDFGFTDKYDPAKGAVSKRGIEASTDDLDKLTRSLASIKHPIDRQLLLLINKRIKGFFAGGVVPPLFAARLETTLAASAKMLAITIDSDILKLPKDPSPALMTEIAVWFNYTEVLGWINKIPNHIWKTALTSNALWARLVMRDYPYVYDVITMGGGTKAWRAIKFMAKNQELTPEVHDARFWKRVYEWAIVTSREVLIYALDYPIITVLSWRNESLLLLSTTAELTGPTVHVRRFNAFTKAVDLDLHLPGFRGARPQKDTQFYTAPPYLTIVTKAIDLERGRVGEHVMTVQTWNVETSQKLVEFSLRDEDVRAFNPVAVLGLREPRFFYIEEASAPQKGHFFLKQWTVTRYFASDEESAPKEQVFLKERAPRPGETQERNYTVRLDWLPMKWHAFSGRYLCYALPSSSPNSVTVIVHDLLAETVREAEMFQFDLLANVTVEAFRYPHLMIKGPVNIGRRRGLDYYFEVRDVSQLGAPVVWTHRIDEPAVSTTTGSLAKGVVLVTTRGERGSSSTFYALAPAATDVHPPTFAGLPIPNVPAWGQSGQQVMGRYVISDVTEGAGIIAILGPHADQLVGVDRRSPPPADLLLSLDTRKRMRPFLASTRLPK
jgi:hypothetical protein